MTTIRTIMPADVPAAMQLWTTSDGIQLAPWENEERIISVLRTWPELSLVATADDNLHGVLMAADYGLRGMIFHLCVSRESRRQAIASRLVQESLARFKQRGIFRVLIGVDNPEAIQFWRTRGFIDAPGEILMQRDM